eukprot:COSAG04_NODE_2416_length_4172_cov_5.533513_2_plen_174_part_01
MNSEDSTGDFVGSRNEQLLREKHSELMANMQVKIPSDAFHFHVVTKNDLHRYEAGDEEAPQPIADASSDAQRTNQAKLAELQKRLDEPGTNQAEIWAQIAKLSKQALEPMRVSDSTGIHWITVDSLRHADRELLIWSHEEEALRVAREKLNIEKFRPLQPAILQAISDGDDVLA